MNHIKKFLFGLLIAVVSIGAQATALSDKWENNLIDGIFRGQTVTFPATIYVGLTTDACTDSALGTEPSGNAYARVAVTSSLANWAGTQAAASTTASTGTGGTTSNNAVITFPTSTGAWGTVVAVRFYDASTAGNMIACIALTSSLNVSASGFTPSFPAGSLTFQIDN